MKGKARWIPWIAILLAVVAVGYYLLNNTEQGQQTLAQWPFGQDDADDSAGAGQGLPDGAERPTLTPEELAAAAVAIQPASNIIGAPATKNITPHANKISEACPKSGCNASRMTKSAVSMKDHDLPGGPFKSCDAAISQ